jgi:hypothetical protein
MTTFDQQKIEDSFPTIYVTLASILIGLVLEDLVSIVRAAENRDPFLWATVVYVLVSSIGVWTGYSLNAITQSRRPRLLDSINVFVLAIGLFITNSSVGQSPTFFFYAAGGYLCTAVYAVHYNMSTLVEALPHEVPFRDWRAMQYPIVPAAIVSLMAGGLSQWGMLDERVELMFVVLLIVCAGAWVFTFHPIWQRLLDEAKVVDDRHER